MRANQFYILTTTESRSIDLFFNVLPNSLWEFCVCLYFAMHYVVSILVLQSS